MEILPRFHRLQFHQRLAFLPPVPRDQVSTLSISAVEHLTDILSNRGRTLEEMDTLFTDSYWIVPMSPAAKVGTHDRERQLAMGKLSFHGSSPLRVIEADSELEGEGVPSKKELGHEEYGLKASDSRV